MNKLLLFCFIFLTFFYPGRTATAQTLHFVFFGDTHDPEIGGPSNVSYTYYDRLADHVKQYAEFQAVKKHRFTGDDFSVTNLKNLLDTLTAGKQDVILFYISAHGWNDGMSEFPMLVMESGEKATVKNSVNLKTVYDQLMAKKARLSIVFGEACNAGMLVRPKSGPARTATHPPLDANVQSFRDLFRRSQLGILACSSERGQLSVSDREEGGRFTQAFFSVIGNYTSSSFTGTADWGNLMKDVKAKTRTISMEAGSGEVQNPYYEIESEDGLPKEIESVVGGAKVAEIVKNPKPATKPEMLTGNPTGKVKKPTDQKPPQSFVRPTTPPAATVKPQTNSKPCFNPTAFETIRTYQRFVENYWKSVDGADLETARESFTTQIYSDDAKEFYANLAQKLQVEHLPDEKQKLETLGNSVLEILEETNGQLGSNNFRMKASSKLAMVVTDLSKIIKEVESIKRDCSEQ